MNSANKTIIAPFDFTTRYIKNFIAEATNIKSSFYFITGERNVNGKSILGVISANITKGDEVKITVYNSSREQADKDLMDICNLIYGDI